MHNKLKIFIIIVLASALTQIASDLYLPSLPALAKALHTPISNIQFTITIYITGLTIAELLYGPLSDAYGRRSPLIVGFSVGLISSIICATSANIATLILGRLLQGIGIGAGVALIRPIMRDLMSGAELAKYGSYGSLVSIGFLATAPLLGGYIEQYIGWRANFTVLAICSLLLLIAMVLFLPETNQHRTKENLKIANIRKNFLSCLKSPLFLAYSFASLLTYAAIVAWLTAGPIVLQTVFGLSPVNYGWVYLVTGLAFAVGAIFNSQLVSKLDVNKMLLFGLITIFTAGVLMLVLKLIGITSVIAIVIPAMVLLLGASLVFPNTSAGALQGVPQIAGAAASLFGVMRMIGGIISSFLLALSHDQSQVPMALAFIICAGLAWILFVVLHRLSQSMV